MSNIILKFDRETYSDLAVNYQQYIQLSEIYKKVANNDNFELYFEYDTITEIFSTYFVLLKEKQIVEMPFIIRKNRKFYVENIVIYEKFMIKGENSVYIINEVLNTLSKDDLNFKKIAQNLSFFEFDTNKESRE